jgi:hypothetical protein
MLMILKTFSPVVSIASCSWQAASMTCFLFASESAFGPAATEAEI